MLSLAPPPSVQLIFDRYSQYKKQIKSEDQQLEVKELLRGSLKAFYRYYWPYMSSDTYIDNWHVDALCDHMTGVYNGEIRTLVVNIPPRSSKSGICSIAFPAWAWCKDPSKKFIYGSENMDLAMEFSRQCRELILQPAYKDLFNVHLHKDAANKKLFINTQFGHRLTVSIGSSVTGFGADIILADDANDVQKVESQSSRADVIRWISNTAVTRVQSKSSSMVCLQQRTHPWDASGYLLSLGDSTIVHLCLPQEYDETRRCVTTFGNKRWEDPRTKHGQLLWPEKWDAEYLKRVKLRMGEYNYATQHQQYPVPEEGGIFKKDSWQWYKIKGNLELKYILQSWDTALTDTPGSCFSVCTTWGIFEDKHEVKKAILLNLWKDRVEYPELRHLAQRMFMNYRDHSIDFKNPIPKSHMTADQVVVEEAVNGFCLLADFRRAGINAVGFKPAHYGKKPMRARLASALIQGGAVMLPCKDYDDEIIPTPYSSKLINECAMYTGQDGESNDVVDSMSQALIYMNERGLIYNQTDPYIGYKENTQKVMNKHLGQ